MADTQNNAHSEPTSRRFQKGTTGDDYTPIMTPPRTWCHITLAPLLLAATQRVREGRTR